MTTFTPAQQKKHRSAFIEECHQNAWGATCHAAFIGDQANKLMVEYQKFGDQHRGILEEIKTLETALDSHTKDNRDKRKQLQEQANVLAQQMQGVGQVTQQLHKNMQQLYANAEQALALAKHAETWEWKEVEANTQETGGDDKVAG